MRATPTKTLKYYPIYNYMLTFLFMGSFMIAGSRRSIVKQFDHLMEIFWIYLC